jgi:hypothetical protein
MQMLENLWIFITKKENRLITEFEEAEEQNSLFIGGGWGWGEWQPLQDESQRMLRYFIHYFVALSYYIP